MSFANQQDLPIEDIAMLNAHWDGNFLDSNEYQAVARQQRRTVPAANGSNSPNAAKDYP
ncbi:hypothetical protein Slin15195_G119320 [Septoria linicola]|uniref:Uncharacterized protein n=1 Tax=Septoria linicola TaxID=215465 RepID=A0A9Q9B459_9PEZI|nr:hypothetical protein Slin14017_G096310 [Septoria linicola]USW58613.1 hypothetical protein Slin15195_G119320 [Septoria linicola]